jgi:hypothetical protein
MLFISYHPTTEQLLPFMKLINIRVAGTFILLYTHTTRPEEFVKSLMDAMQYGSFKMDSLEIASALVPWIQTSHPMMPYVKGLFTLLKTLPEPQEKLMDDDSTICYLANKLPEVRKELEEYRLHYSY